MNRAFCTPYINSETLGDSEDTYGDTDEYELEEQAQDQEYEPVVDEEPHARGSEQMYQ